jgi:hypothetical protein
MPSRKRDLECPAFTRNASSLQIAVGVYAKAVLLFKIINGRYIDVRLELGYY